MFANHVSAKQQILSMYVCNVSLHCNLMSVLFNNGGLVSAQVQAESHLVRVMRNLMIWLRILSLVATIMDGV